MVSTKSARATRDGINKMNSHQEMRRLEALERIEDKKNGVVYEPLPKINLKSIDLYSRKYTFCGEKKPVAEKIEKPLCQFCNKRKVPRINSKFCSKDCYEASRKVPKKKEKSCLTCGKPLAHQKKYCSKSCVGKAVVSYLHSKEVREKSLSTFLRNQSLKTPRPPLTKNCAYCGKQFEVGRHTGRRYCNQRCGNLAYQLRKKL